jgi:hypothetical protein
MVTKEKLLEDLERVYSLHHVQYLLKENGNGWSHEGLNSRTIEKVLAPFVNELQHTLENDLRRFLEQEGLKLEES